MNRKLNRGLKSFGEMISYFIPSSEGNGVASSQQEDRRLLMGEEALKGAGKFSLVCPGFAPSEHCVSMPTFSQSLVTSGSLLCFPKQSLSHTPAPTDILSWPPEAVA